MSDVVDRYKLWKETHVPVLYDWLSSRRFLWPHSAIEWGCPFPSDNLGGGTPASYTTRTLYTAERTGGTGGGRYPNTLLLIRARIPEGRTTGQANTTPWVDQPLDAGDHISAPEFLVEKRIIHPGEVNKIRLIAPHVVVTNTDSPKLYIWDFDSQRNRRFRDKERKRSMPTCTLSGHAEKPQFGLSVSSSTGTYETSDDVWIASGGSDGRVLVWKLQDYKTKGRDIEQNVILGPEPGQNAQGQDAMVIEDVSFNRVNRNLVAACGRERSIRIWDIRQSDSAVSVVRQAHTDDINALDFGGLDEHLLVSCGSDARIKVWDKRFLMSQDGVAFPCNVLFGHHGQVNVVSWNKYRRSVCASGGDDGYVMVWDSARCTSQTPQHRSAPSPALMIKHAGHSYDQSRIVELDWLPDERDEWCLASLSESIGDAGGSALQMWRISEKVIRPYSDIA